MELSVVLESSTHVGVNAWKKPERFFRSCSPRAEVPRRKSLSLRQEQGFNVPPRKGTCLPQGPFLSLSSSTGIEQDRGRADPPRLQTKQRPQHGKQSHRQERRSLSAGLSCLGYVSLNSRELPREFLRLLPPTQAP